jgi:hypothetical protein
MPVCDGIQSGRAKSTGGEVANALVCKTSIRGFDSRPVLHASHAPKLRIVIALGSFRR